MTARTHKKSDNNTEALLRAPVDNLSRNKANKQPRFVEKLLKQRDSRRHLFVSPVRGKNISKTYSITLPSGIEMFYSVSIDTQKEFEDTLVEALAKFEYNSPDVISSSMPSLEIYKTDPLLGKHESLLNLIFAASEWYDSVTLCKLAGFSGANPSAQPHKWKKAGKVFALRRGNTDFYPSYAFGDDFRPLLAMKEILGVFHDKKSDLKIAAWFASENSWLRNQRPLDLILASPEAVIEAAEFEVSPIDHG